MATNLSGLRLIANQQKGFNTLAPFFLILVIFPVAGVPAFNILGCLTRLGETAFLGSRMGGLVWPYHLITENGLRHASGPVHHPFRDIYWQQIISLSTIKSRLNPSAESREPNCEKTTELNVYHFLITLFSKNWSIFVSCLLFLFFKEDNVHQTI